LKKLLISFGFLLLAFLGLVVLAFQLSFDPQRSFLKEKVSRVFNKIASWSDHNDEFFTEQHIFINEATVAFVSKNIISEGESINLRMFGTGKVNLFVEYFDESGTLHSTEEKKISISSDVPETFSSFYGFEGNFDEILITPKIDNGWVDVGVNPEFGRKINLPVLIENTKSREVLFVESTDTLNAYVSAYDLPTHYDRKSAPLGAFTRPVAMPQNYDIKNFTESNEVNCKDHLINADLVHKQMINDLNHPISLVSDDFLDQYENLAGVKVLIFGAHNEYWTEAKAENILRFVENGGHLLFLGGNTAWRQVKRGRKFDAIFGSNLLNHGFDRLIREVLGTYYDINGYDTYSSYKLMETEAPEWMDPASFVNTTSFGIGTDFKCCEGLIGGASGLETDKLLSESKEEFTIIAKGNNWFEGGADIVYRKFHSGGTVLNFGSVALWHRTQDQTIRALVKQFLDNALLMD
jgi:hypothetical protein